MQTLALIHPNLIMKNAQFHTLSDHVSRALLERFLRKGPAQISDECISNEITRVIVHFTDELTDDEELLDYANTLIDFRPSRLLDELHKTLKVENLSKLSSTRYDVSALNLLWRVRAIDIAEFMTLCIVGLCCGLVGTISLYTKTVRLVTMLEDPEHVAAAVFFFVMFVNQVISIISVGGLLRWRVETFLFGGNDAHVSDEESYVMQLYLADLTKKVWDSDQLSFWEKIAVMVQLDDDDLQQLTVEQDDHVKATVTLSVKKHMLETHQVNLPLKHLADWAAAR